MEENKDVKKKYTVVLVDDDKFLLNMYAMKFTKEGIGVTAFQSSEDALEKFRQGLHPDAILLDVVMPGMDGIELLKTLRDEKLITNSAVVILSNQGAPADIEKAKVFKIDGYIVKATTIPSEVLREVSRIVDERKWNNL